MLFRRFVFENRSPDPVNVDLYLSPDPGFPEPAALPNVLALVNVPVEWELCALHRDGIHHLKVLVKDVNGVQLAQRICAVPDPAHDHMIEARAVYSGGSNLAVQCFYVDLSLSAPCVAGAKVPGKTGGS